MPWQEQIAYYRARAAEYEATSYRDVPGADRRVAALVGRLRPGGDLLEIACGTGMWTRHLAGCAATVTAIDAAPEMIALARQQVTAGNVTFVAADILALGAAAAFRHCLFRLLALTRAQIRVRTVLVTAAQRAGQRRPRAVCRRPARGRRPGDLCRGIG